MNKYAEEKWKEKENTAEESTTASCYRTKVFVN